MQFSMTGQEKGDRLIQVTAWAGLTVYTVKELIFMLTNFIKLDENNKQEIRTNKYLLL